MTLDTHGATKKWSYEPPESSPCLVLNFFVIPYSLPAIIGKYPYVSNCATMLKTKFTEPLSSTQNNRLLHSTCIEISTMEKQRQTVFATRFLEDLAYWVGTRPRLAKKILALVQEVTKDPFKGTGKPEPLKADFSGLWSRRIDEEHRLVYEVLDAEIRFVQCRYHYHE